MEERYQLTIERLKMINAEQSVKEPLAQYFQKVALFLLKIAETKDVIEVGKESSIEDLEARMEDLFEDQKMENYQTSFLNPSYAATVLGQEMGAFLSAVYTELQGNIAYVYEGRLEYLTIGNELFIELYNRFEEEECPNIESLKEIFYWYASDYCDVFAADWILEMIDPSAQDYVVKKVKEADLTDLRYLYEFGEYVGENEKKIATYLNQLPQEQIDRMADTFTEGYRIGFVNTGKDITKKKVVEVRYSVGFERVVRKAIQNFEEMGLKAVVIRSSLSSITKSRSGRIHFRGAFLNRQYEYDHKDDMGLFLDKQFMERRLEVMQTTFEQNKEQAALFGGPAVMETFGEIPFSPKKNPDAIRLNEKQEQLCLQMASRISQMTNHYIIGEERSFTIISWPVPEIGERFEEIFDEVVRINTLDAEQYRTVQQKLIDALDQGEYVRVLGAEGNKTDLRIQLNPLSDPEKQTNFENCVADVNIPVGEVFTTPVLEGTDGVLFVSKVYLDGLQYQNLEIHFRDGKTTQYTCSNFGSESENKKFIEDTLLKNHPFLPLGEFAIGTNTTAYAAAKKYDIADKFTTLIAEKMGPHFAIGDTCYNWEEDVPTFNPDGKEIIAKENSISALRIENPQDAYFQCHTDITIPYDELGKLSVFTKDGEEIVLLENGHFVLDGTEFLNEPLDV